MKDIFNKNNKFQKPTQAQNGLGHPYGHSRQNPSIALFVGTASAAFTISIYATDLHWPKG